MSENAFDARTLTQRYAIPHDPEEQAACILEQDSPLLAIAQRFANIVQTLEPLHEGAPTPRVLIVGGFVRDALLGLHPKDLDLEVYGLSAEALEALLQKIFPKQLNLVGRSFGVIKLHIGDGLDLDISLPRRESKSGKGHKAFHVTGDPFMSIEEAARRRDFTMNALAADPVSGEVYDYFDGMNHLRRGELCITDAERFQDDPLRVYRAMQFCGRMHLWPNEKSLSLLKEMVAWGDLNDLAPERITEEWQKLLLKSSKPSVGLELLREIGAIETQYPELHALIDCPQEPEWHPEGDVWIHTMMVLDAAANIVRRPEGNFSEEERLAACLGAICHDFGKPSTTKLEEGRVRSRGHEEAGVEPTEAFFERLAFSEHLQRTAVCIAKDHLKPDALFRDLQKGLLSPVQYRNLVRRLLKRLGTVPWRVFLAGSEADFRGRTLPNVDTKPYVPGDVFANAIVEYGIDKEAKTPILQGRDLLELGFPAGKLLGQIMKDVEMQRDAGTLSTREEAFVYVRANFGNA